ncbi:NADP-dependent oxidoreductase domain-containing protein [Rhypophila decipiens]|uniref:NADP-dependent oxidoreductase domain-containing protein n=1 Tax=Rhypophila decipiens TaxID=261697 RepID=A0AAN6YL41_9PEZI|nr:NADP-dependent oxidoreductase domain-containing protein [Rhypophila decipiens]
MTTKTGSTAKEMLSRTIQLPNNLKIPQIQLGLYMMSPTETTRSVRWALEAGYRGFDSAQWYENEAETASSIASFLSSPNTTSSGITRSDIFYTTKLKDNSTSVSQIRRAVDKSLSAAKPLGYVDLFLLHSPLGGKAARMTSWKTLEEYVLAGDGDDEQVEIKSIGVSNYGVAHIEELMASNPRVKPAVNQIEVHPFNTQNAIRECCAKYGIVVEAYAPLARGMKFGGRSKTLKGLADKYGVSEAQLMVRWSVQHGFVTLPKSAKKDRLVTNADVGGFEISKEDMATLDGLDEHLVTDWDPTDAP